jgi:hypothetical protein
MVRILWILSQGGEECPTSINSTLSMVVRSSLNFISIKLCIKDIQHPFTILLWCLGGVILARTQDKCVINN